MLDMEMVFSNKMVADQFKGKKTYHPQCEKTLHLGADFIKSNFGITIEI